MNRAALFFLFLSGPAFAGKPASVILVTIDTLRADHLPAYGYAGVKTPALDGLVKDGVLFKRALSHAPITLAAHTSIMTGLYPMTHGVRNNGDYYVPESLTTLAKILRSSGYKTAAFVSSFILDSRFGLNQGFDVYDCDMSEGRPRTLPSEFMERRGGDTLAHARKWLEGLRGDHPFFLWTHFYDPHHPYEPPEPFLTRYKADPYDGEIAYVDSLLKTLFDELKKKGLYDDALIIVTADHGESLGEHGEAAHSIFIYNATQHIPLIVKLPGRAKAGTLVGSLVRHIDILPTLLDLLGLKDESLPGRNLFDSEERASYAEAYLPKDYYGWSELSSIERGRYKYIEAPRPELYDMVKDTAEADNLILKEAGLAAGLKADLAALKKSYASSDAQARAEKDLDPQVAAGLKALGYMSDAAPALQDAGKDPKDMIVWQEAIERAMKFAKDGDHEKAVSALLPLLKVNPENLTARSLLAGAYRKLKRIDEAVREYRAIHERDPRFLAAYQGLVELFIKDKVDFPAAEKELAAAFLLAPKETSLWVLKADLQQERGRLREALENYRKAEVLGEQSAGLYVGLGSALNKTGRLAEARDKLALAVRLEPENVEAHYNLGVVYDHMERWAPAEEQYRLAVRYDPKNYLSYGNLGSLYQRNGRPGEAEAALKAALGVKADDVTSLYNLGSLYLAGRRPREAVDWLKKAVTLSPGLTYGHNNLAMAYSELGELDLALEQYKLIADDPAADENSRAAALGGMARIRRSHSRK